MCRGTCNGEDVYVILLTPQIRKKLRNNPKWLDLHKGLPVDKCIGIEIEFLLHNGVNTLGCCCGHEKTLPTCLIDQDSVDVCIDLGYVPHEYSKLHTEQGIFEINLKGKLFNKKEVTGCIP